MPQAERQANIPRTFLTEGPAATLSVGLNLLSRRSSALADFWRSFAEIRQPTELMAVQLNYWTQLVDDYQEAISESVSQLAGAAERGGARPPGAPTTRAI